MVLAYAVPDLPIIDAGVTELGVLIVIRASTARTAGPTACATAAGPSPPWHFPRYASRSMPIWPPNTHAASGPERIGVRDDAADWMNREGPSTGCGRVWHGAGPVNAAPQRRAAGSGAAAATWFPGWGAFEFGGSVWPDHQLLLMFRSGPPTSAAPPTAATPTSATGDCSNGRVRCTRWPPPAGPDRG